eukprot:6338928-Ditylum_brightwellii.AAC.1
MMMNTIATQVASVAVWTSRCHAASASIGKMLLSRMASSSSSSTMELEQYTLTFKGVGGVAY